MYISFMSWVCRSALTIPNLFQGRYFYSSGHMNRGDGEEGQPVTIHYRRQQFPAPPSPLLSGNFPQTLAAGIFPRKLGEKSP